MKTYSIKKSIKWAALSLGLLLMAFAPLNAQFVELRSNPADVYCCGGTTGTGRATGFLSNQTIAISEVALEGSIINQSYDVQIYASPDGITVGALLHSASGVTGGTPATVFNTVPISYTFNAGSYYIVNWRATGNGTFEVAIPGIPHGITYYWPYSFPINTPGNEFTIIEGFEGFFPDASNPLIPTLRFRTGRPQQVPTMGEWGLIIFGLSLLSMGAIFVFRKRSRLVLTEA